MMHSRWVRQFGIALVVAVLALVGMAMPVSAQSIVPVEFSGDVEAGYALDLRCPSGYQVRFREDGSPDATAFFYRSHQRKGFLGQFAPNSAILDPYNVRVGVTWIVPKGARFADANLFCEQMPNPTQTVVRTGATGLSSQNFVTAECPPEYPYLVSVQEVIGDVDGNLSTPEGQYPITDYTTTSYSVSFGPIGSNQAWRVTMTCSAVSQA
jgi:hypothetical protein